MKGTIKRLLSLTVAVVILVTLTVGCGGSQTNQQPSSGDATKTDAPKADTPKAESSSDSTGSDKDFSELYSEVAKLQGEDALKFFESLKSKGLSETEILQFFIDLPLSEANQQIYKMYDDEGFEMYNKAYPRGTPYEGFEWQKGSGTSIKGPFSKLDIKLPFSDYVPVAEGPIGDANKEYKIGVVFHGFSHPWLINWADSAKWEGDRHSNIKMEVLDAEFDNNKWATIVDNFIAQRVDGIVAWPAVEAPSGPPVRRAEEAGIPVVTVDRLAGYDGVSARVTGNFPANGAQCGMYLIWKLAQEGDLNAKMVLLRKPLGSTADAVRTGHMLKVLSYFPGIEILQSYHDNDSREEAFVNAQSALQAYPEIDVFFGTGDHEALAAIEAVKMANKMNSRKDGKKMIFLSIDDSKEALTHVKNGEFEVNTPYTPLFADIGVRTLINILSGKEMPQDVITPNIPMVTQNGDEIFGFKTQTPDEWYEYTFGPPME
jgi:ABC-type sugar transport system substrate-binding protein